MRKSALPIAILLLLLGAGALYFRIRPSEEAAPTVGAVEAATEGADRGRPVLEGAGASVESQLGGPPPLSEPEAPVPREEVGLRESFKPEVRPSGGVLGVDSGRELLVHVVGPDARGVEGVELACERAKATSSADGTARLIGLPATGFVVISVTVPTGWMKRDSLRVGNVATSVTIELERGFSIAGQVFGRDGLPAPAGTVRLGATGPGALIETDGRFRIEGLPMGAEGDLRVQAQSDGSLTWYGWRAVKGVRAGTEDLVVRFDPGVAVEGQVVDARGVPWNEKEGFMMVRAVAEDGGGAGGKVGDEGRFTIDGLRPGTYALSTSGVGTPDATMTVVAPSRGVRIALPEVAFITGRVLGAGNLAQSNVRVEAFASTRVARVQTRGDGTFKLSVTGEGPFELIARKGEEYARVEGVRPGDTAVTMSLERGLCIEGQIEVPAGVVISEDWSVWVKALDGHVRTSATLRADGTFSLWGLPPGRYQLTCVHRGGARSATVEVEAGTSSLWLQLPPR